MWDSKLTLEFQTDPIEKMIVFVKWVGHVWKRYGEKDWPNQSHLVGKNLVVVIVCVEVCWTAPLLIELGVTCL